MPNSNVDTEYDGRRDHLGRFIRPHVPTAEEELRVLHQGESKKSSERDEHFTGSNPLPPIKPPKYATPKWKGSYVEDK